MWEQQVGHLYVGTQTLVAPNRLQGPVPDSQMEYVFLRPCGRETYVSPSQSTQFPGTLRTLKATDMHHAEV